MVFSSATGGVIVGSSTRGILAERIQTGGHLGLHYLPVLVVLVDCRKTLPGQTAADEVHHNVAHALEVVTTTLLNAEMSGNRGVSGGSCKALVAPVRNMSATFGVFEVLGEAEVDDVDSGGAFAQTQKEVVGLDVPMDEQV